MQLRNAIIFHTFLVLGQPVYFGYQWFFNRQYFSSTSPAWLTLCLVFWLLIVTRFTIPIFTSPLRYFPSPADDVFPFGHGWLLRNQTPPTQVVRVVAETPNEGVIAFWDPFYLRVRTIITNPEAIMEVVNTRNYDWEKPPAAKKFLSRILGEGLVNVEGNMHKAMRKTVAPAFSGRQIRDLVPLFWSKGRAFADAMAREAGKSPTGEVEIMHQMSRVTLDVIGAAGIGMDFDTINGDENKIGRLYAAITNENRGGSNLLFFLISVLIPPWLVRKMHGTPYARIASATQELRSHIRNLLAEKKRNMKHNSAGHTDILSTIMRSGDFSDDYLCDQLLTFFAAGHDTTASALTWTTWFLSLNPSIQDRLRKECHDHLSRLQPEAVNADTFDQMPYLTAVCNETLRFYPTVPMTARIACVDTKVGQLHIPKGTHIFISPWMINRHLDLWGKDAGSWNPDRWLEGPLAAAGGANHPYAFLTFLYGPRSCIGQDFARKEMKVILAALILRFRFTPPENGEKVEVGGFVTIKPKGGLRLKLQDLTQNDTTAEKTYA